MMNMQQDHFQKKIIVIGHRNPDTDSIVSAIAYAALKRQQGYVNCVPARAGKLTPQTEYVLRRFGVEPPIFIPDMSPKVEYFLTKEPVTIQAKSALWDALLLMEKNRIPAVPVVDVEGHYQAYLSHHTFTENIVRKTDPHRKVIIPASIDLLAQTLRAQILLSFNADTVIKSRILVAGSTKETFEEVLKTEMPTNAIAIVENRESIVRLCLKYKVRAIVLANGQSLSRDLYALAQTSSISVLSSPYDIASTIYLVLYSMPVSSMAAVKQSVKPVTTEDAVRSIFSMVQSSPTRSLPVVNREGKVVGVINERDLYKQPNVDIIMVDHNELTLGAEGLDQFHIIEIIDHHKLGNFPTREPINFINRVVGSTATIVACLYQEQKAILTPAIAGLLLSAIITDTLALQSPTTTDVDRAMAEYLAGLLNLEVADLAKDIFAHGARMTDLSEEKLLNLDAKAYHESGVNFSVAQLESSSYAELEPRLPALREALEAKCKHEKLFFAALMVTDITALNSLLLVVGDARFLEKIPFPKHTPSGLYLCKGIMSRKKQLLPLLLEQLSEVLGHNR